MALSTTQKAVCTTSKKQGRIGSESLTCCRCRKDFCNEHVTEYWKILKRWMNEVTLDHKELWDKTLLMNHRIALSLSWETI
jgi:hypothetical protein